MAEETLVADKSNARVLDAESKRALYAELRGRIEATIVGEDDLLAAMVSIVCILHNAFPYYYWTGFYRRVSEERLLIGPYQGTLGCLWIDMGRGVCGTAAQENRTVVVEDVNEFPGHIACDAASASEIVVPIHGADGTVIGVLDVDSTLPAAFDDIDARELEGIVALLRERKNLPLVMSQPTRVTG